MMKTLSFYRYGSMLTLSSLLLAGCNFIATSGPSQSQVTEQNNKSVVVIDVTDTVTHRLLEAQKRSKFSEVFTGNAEPQFMVGSGDTLEVTLWEAPPATLFASAQNTQTGVAAPQTTTFPEQMIAADGTISIPFAGIITAAGKSPQQIEAEIVTRLTGLANHPQVLVRVTHNATANVTIVGEVKQSLRMPLTAKGEKLLDALAASGGTAQPVDKMTIEISRQGKVLAMPMDDIIRDPFQNVSLQSGDVITALHQPFSFIVLGATGKNAEIDFESKGITLAQALGRIGGLDDNRANPQGVFIFRFENKETIDIGGKVAPVTSEGKVPVVYRVDLKDPQTFLIAQNFPVNNKDVIYVANAPSTEFQKFMNIIYTGIFSAINIKGL